MKDEIIIIEDTREPKVDSDKGNPQHTYMISRGYKVIRAPLAVGDYALATPKTMATIQAVQSWRRNSVIHAFKEEKRQPTAEERKKLEDIENMEQAGLALTKMDTAGTFSRVVDLKRSIKELNANFCYRDHQRVMLECKRAANLGIDITFLLVHDTMQTIDDLIGVMYYDEDLDRFVDGADILTAIEPFRALPHVHFEVTPYNRSVQAILRILQNKGGDLL